MIRIQNGQKAPTQGIEAEGGRTPRIRAATPLPDYLAFSSKGSGPENSPKRLRALGYVRVSTAEQAESGNGTAAQGRAIEAEAARRGWSLRFASDSAKSGKTMVGRHGLEMALADLAAGRADILVVAKLDRLIRSVADFATIVAAAKSQGWALVALDLAVDTSTPQGEFMANVMASMAQFERRLIGQRTRDAMAALKVSGPKPGKKAIGTPPRHGPVNERVIRNLRANGLTIRAIAVELGLPHTTVQSVLTR